MKDNWSKKILSLTTTLLILITSFLSLSFPNNNSIYLFLLIFGLIYWQRKRLLRLDRLSKSQNLSSLICLLTGWVWAIFLEYNLGRLPYHPHPAVNLLLGIGFYLPYFAIWLKLIKRYRFTFFEVFYLGGFGRLVFDALITRKLFLPLVLHEGLIVAFLAIGARGITTVSIFGALTTLPYFYLTDREKTSHHKPLKQYLLGMTSGLLAPGTLIVWIILLKLAVVIMAG